MGSLVGVIVSIGTARGAKEPGNNALVRVIEDSFSTATDPESVHRALLSLEYLHGRYWRLNDSGAGLTVQLDEWKPSGRFVKDPGRTTLNIIRTHFNKWAKDNDNAKTLRQCAKDLVARRVARSGNASLWEAYATGAIFVCNFSACPNTRFESKDDLARHLSRDHLIANEELERRVKLMTKRWQYQVPPQKWGMSGGRRGG